jgi:hypothetical protein
MEKRLGVMASICHSSSEKVKIGGSKSRLIWAKSETLSPK